MGGINSSLIFEDYKINYIKLVENEKFDFESKKATGNLLDIMDLDYEIEEREKYKKNVIIIVKIGNSDNLPYRLDLKLTGVFEYCDANDGLMQEEKEDLFTKNAIAILFPYVRSLISTYTSTSNVATLILPTLNVVKLLENKKHSQ